MQRRICPICDHPIKYGHYCSFCKQWIRNPNYVNATYYLNERHPAHETDCEYHNAGSASWETSARAGTDAIRTLADRAKAYSQTQKAAGAGRQASVRTLLLCDTQLVCQLRHGIVLICPAVERDQGEKWKRVDFHIMAWLVVAFCQGEKAECKLQEVDTGVF